MSLVQGHRIVVGAAVLAAAGLPTWMLAGGVEPLPLPPAPMPTQVNVAESGSISYALSAPPFTRDRVPHAETEPSGSEGAETPLPSPAPVLVGVVVAERGRAVALARSADGETLTLARGEAVDGWTLTAVARDSATFERDGARHTARLDFTNRDDAPAAPSPAAPAAIPARSPDLFPPAEASTRPSNRNP